MIVVDVNIIAYLWIPGDLSTYAEKVLLRDDEWVSSILWKSEFRNILAKYLRGGHINSYAAQSCLDAAEKQMAQRDYIVPSALIMQKVAISNCSAYDCEYVALAENLQVPLVTSDKQILREFPQTAVSLKKFAQ